MHALAPCRAGAVTHPCARGSARTGFLSKPLRLEELREVLATHKLA
jgi:hypothetical protein